MGAGLRDKLNVDSAPRSGAMAVEGGTFGPGTLLVYYGCSW